MSEGAAHQIVGNAHADNPPTTENAAQRDQSQKERYYLVWRAAAATAVVMSAYIWWAHNYGEGLGGVPFVATIAGAYTFAMGVLDESYKNGAKKWFAKWLLSLAVLVPGCLAVIILLGSRAPVIVLNQQSDSLHACLSPAESSVNQEKDAVSEKDKPARFHVWSTPLGRPFILKVQGYAPKTVLVAAPAGVTVSPERDLIPQVSLLVRPTADGMSELLSGGTLHVYREQNGQQKEIATDTPHSRSSFLVGVAPVPLSHDLLEDWRLELAGQQMSYVSRANQLLAWKAPRLVKLLSPSDELTAHQKLRVVVQTAGSKQDLECGAIELPEGVDVLADLALHSCPRNQP